MAKLSANGIELKRRIFKRDTDIISYSERTNGKMLLNHKMFIDYGYRSEWYTAGWKQCKLNWEQIELKMKHLGYVEEIK